MECQFCDSEVRFSQHEMGHRVFELGEAENNWWLCSDCASIREDGDRYEAGDPTARGECVDCGDDAEYAVTAVKKTPAGDVRTGGTMFHVLCADHFEERAS